MRSRGALVQEVKPARNTEALDELFNPFPPTLTVDEAAELLNVGRKNAYLWLRNGVIPGYKLGGTWFIIRDELKEALRAGTNAPNKEGTDPEAGDLKEE